VNSFEDWPRSFSWYWLAWDTAGQPAVVARAEWQVAISLPSWRFSNSVGDPSPSR